MGERRSNRRQFLKGHAAVEAVADLADRGAPADEEVGASGETVKSSSVPVDSHLIQLTRAAMACEFQVYLNAGQYADGVERAVEALDLVEQLEDQLTVFRDHSEVSQLNRRAASGPVRVESRLFALLEQAVALHANTAGAYDITSAPLTKTWGFHRRAGRIPGQQELDAALASVGSQHLMLEAAQQTVQYARPGLEINLGSIGKGYALDRCAEHLTTGGVADFLLHGGNSSVLAHGSHAGHDGWTVGLPHPLRPGERVGEFVVRNGALGTSGTVAQFFLHQGKRYGHILDPRTGYPAEGVLSATVVAPTAALADALSTAFFVAGPEAATAYCERHPEIGMVLIVPGEKSGGIQVQAINLAQGTFRLL